MSIKKWPGAVVSDTPVEPAGNYQDSAASGVWTLEQQAYWEAQGLWPVPGNTNPSAFIENLFSTYLYTGNGSTQTITNGIDLDGEGGLVWIKDRNSGAKGHALFDTARGVNKKLQSQSTGAEYSGANQLTAFNATGFDLGSGSDPNGSGTTYASWSFRKQPKFFDVVTWTGTGGARTISHNLGSTPGCIIVKWYNVSGENWTVYHRGLNGGTNPQDYGIYLNLTNAAINESGFWNDTEPTSTQFTVGGNLNSSYGGGGQYVAYLFAHDAGGFGDDGEQNVISCGSYTGTGVVGNTINLGYEPQWLLIKNSTFGSYPNWFIFDNMRGMTVGAGDPYLYANLSQIEYGGSSQYLDPTATGFKMMHASVINETGQTYIYIAIRRGPMKVPTSATTVFSPFVRTGTGATAVITTPNFVVDSAWIQQRTSGWQASKFFDRLRGATNLMYSNTTSAEVSDATTLNSFASNVGFTLGDDSNNYSVNRSGEPYINYAIGRAPGFMDVVCYTGTGVAKTEAHNLAAVPELMIVKQRSGGGYGQWFVYTAALGNTKILQLESSYFEQTDPSAWNSTSPTSSLFTVGTAGGTNYSGSTFVAYLFASLPGISKVSSYTGTGADLNVDCGFSAGARFILIKRTDSTGDWYVWDSARGIVAGNDPYLLLNSAAAEVTGTDYVDADPAGFTVTSSAPAGLNASGGSYIFLAIA